MSERKSQPKSQKAKSTAGKRRRQWGAMLTGKRLVAAVSLVLVVLAGTGGWWAWSGGHAQRAVEKMRWRVIAATSQLGFKVDEILVVGRRETRQEERQPIAIWQHKGEFALIDHTGEVIMRHGLARFSDLIVVVGKEAPKRASSLLHMLSAAPELIPFVKAAQWVGERRWNLRLKGGIDVRLPEADAAAAWQRLADYERAHRVLERDVQVLDLRIPDRLIVRKTPRPESDKKKGQET
jgi:cell division protein FtsQ